MGANLGANVIRGIVEKAVKGSQTTDQPRRRRVSLAEMERVRQRNGSRQTFLGGIQPFGGERRRGGGLFGGAASTAAQQTFGT